MDNLPSNMTRMQIKNRQYDMEEILSRFKAKHGPMFNGMTAINYEEESSVSWNTIYKELNHISLQNYDFNFIESKILGTNRQHNEYIGMF